MSGERQVHGRQPPTPIAEIIAPINPKRIFASPTKVGCPLVAANNGRCFTSVTNAVDIGRTNRMAANTSHFVGDVLVEAPLGTLARNRLVPRIRRAPDDIAIVKIALCARGLRNGKARANREQRYKNSLHYNFLPVLRLATVFHSAALDFSA
jgi:hypothetical protein